MSRPSSAGGAAGGLGAVKVGGSKHGGSGGTTASAAAAAVGVPGSVSVTAAAVALPITALPGQSAELTALFECPVCFDYVLPPILQCQAGHLVCNQCRQKLSCCPTCRGPLTPSIRNLAMEKVASTLPFPCKECGISCSAAVSACDEVYTHRSVSLEGRLKRFWRVRKCNIRSSLMQTLLVILGETLLCTNKNIFLVMVLYIV